MSACELAVHFLRLVSKVLTFFVKRLISLLPKVADVIRENLPNFDLARINKVGRGISSHHDNILRFLYDHIILIL